MVWAVLSTSRTLKRKMRVSVELSTSKMQIVVKAANPISIPA